MADPEPYPPRYSAPARLLGLLFGACWSLPMAILGAFLIGTVAALPFAWIPRGRREHITTWTIIGWAWWVSRLSLLQRVTVVGRERLPRDGAYLVISNHRSWADIPLSLWLTHSQLISKRLVLYLPFIGIYGYISGTIFFDRRNPDDRKRVLDEVRFMLRSGVSYGVYPEGTRTRTGHLREKVHLRLVELAAEMGVPVVPAVLWGTERCVPLDFPAAFPFAQVGLEVGAPLLRSPNQSPEEFARLAWEQVRALAERRGVS